MKAVKFILNVSLAFLSLQTLSAQMPNSTENIIKSDFSEDRNIEGKTLDLPSIFEYRDYKPESLPEFKWLPDTKSYSFVRLLEDGRQEIVRTDIKSGKSSILVDADLLNYNGQQVFVEDYSFTPDLSTVMLFANSRRVWRYNTRGDFFLLDIKNRTMVKVAPEAEASQVQFAQLSPDGSKVAFVYKHNVYVQDVASGAIKQYTNDGSDVVINGTFDWAYEEEFHCRDGLRWSPDSRKLAFWKIDSSETGTFYMINNTDSIYSRPIPIPYPKVGTAMSGAFIGVIHLDDDHIVWMDVDGDPYDNYIPYMDWAYTSDELILEQIPRVQTKNHVILANIYDGSSKTVYTEDSNGKYWLDVNTRVIWINKGQEFLWLSESDGWNHLYAITRDGSSKRCITNGDYDVLSMNYYDERNQCVYFTSSLNSAITRMDYRVNLDGKTPAEAVDPTQTRGSHSYNIAPSSRYALHCYTTSTEPLTADLIDLKNNKVIRNVVSNSALKEKLAALDLPEKEFFRVDIGDEQLDAYIIKPRDFDPGKKYPVLFYVYGEPINTTVTDSWEGDNYLYHQCFVQEGYIVMSVENRGTPSPRGVAFRKHSYKTIGVTTPVDQAKAVKAILAERPYIDKDRVGVWGWSGGGSMTLNLMLKYGDIYKTGVAVAPVPDQTLYDSFYQERYMLTPELNYEGLYNGSPVHFAEGLKGNLLLIHGTGDDNVHYQGTERMINEFVKHKKQFTMFSYPNRSHGIYEGENTSIHLREMMFNYIMNNL